MHLKEARAGGQGEGQRWAWLAAEGKGQASPRPPGRTEEGSAPGAGRSGSLPGGTSDLRASRGELCACASRNTARSGLLAVRQTGQTALWRAGVALSRSLGPAAWEED